jgi:hypothetical protein
MNENLCSPDEGLYDYDDDCLRFTVRGAINGLFLAGPTQRPAEGPAFVTCLLPYWQLPTAYPLVSNGMLAKNR